MSSSKVRSAPPLSRASALGQEAHVDAALRICGGRLEGAADEPDGLAYIVGLDCLAQPHLGVCLGQTDHGLELSGGGSNALLSCAHILA
jgi:hypothetical protein